ncbi:MAG: tyrosine recombinase [Acidimicrobiales bacterium]
MAASSTSSKRALEEYLQWLTVERGRSRATIDAYRRDLTRLLAWMGERDLEPATLAANDLEAYFDELRGPRSASSVARAVSSVRGWLGFLVDEGQLDQDPSSRLASARRGRSLPKPLSEEEMARLIDGVGDEGPRDRRDRALLELLYGTGARVSEVVGLALEDLDFDEELILVTGKGSRQRLVPMGAGLRTALVNYLEPGGRRELIGEQRPTRLFLNSRGGALTRQGVDLIVRRRALAAGIPRSRVSAHVFRHSCATHMLAHGADIRVVQELLGHASIATTQVYTAVSVGSLQREYRQAHPRAHE